jgi:hypothetical protein
MTIATANRRNATALVAGARGIGHLASFVWCDAVIEQSSYMPTTKRQRLKEPSHG